MKKLCLLLLFLPFLFNSCDKDKEPNALNKRAILTVQVINNSGIPLVGAYVTISNRLFEGKTDGKGVFTSGELLEGEYIVNAVYKKNNVSYSTTKSVLIFGSENNELVLNPYENTQSVTLKITNSKKEPRAYIYVAISETYYTTANIFFNSLDMIPFKGKTNSNGQITFNEVPAERLYYIKYYTSPDDYSYDPNPYQFYLEKDKSLNITVLD